MKSSKWWTAGKQNIFNPTFIETFIFKNDMGQERCSFYGHESQSCHDEGLNSSPLWWKFADFYLIRWPLWFIYLSSVVFKVFNPLCWSWVVILYFEFICWKCKMSWENVNNENCCYLKSSINITFKFALSYKKPLLHTFSTSLQQYFYVNYCVTLNGCWVWSLYYCFNILISDGFHWPFPVWICWYISNNNKQVLRNISCGLWPLHMRFSHWVTILVLFV